MINKEESVRRYLNAYLEKKWSIIHDTNNGSCWIMDIKNKKWIVKATIYGHAYYERNFFLEVSTLYDMKLIDVMPLIKDWVEEAIKRDVGIIHGSLSMYALDIDNVIKTGHIEFA